MEALTEADVHARLPFAGGGLVLFSDRTFQVRPDDALRERHRRFAAETDTSALKWGSSLLVGLAFVGAAAYHKGRKPVGWAFFGLGGAAALMARQVRRAAREWDGAAFAPQPLARVELGEEPDGALRLAMGGSPATPPWTLRLEPGEYDPREAGEFLRAVAEARAQ